MKATQHDVPVCDPSRCCVRAGGNDDGRQHTVYAKGQRTKETFWLSAPIIYSTSKGVVCAFPSLCIPPPHHYLDRCIQTKKPRSQGAINNKQQYNMGGLSTAEKNRRKRERKKREKEERRQQDEQEADATNHEEEKKDEEEEVEIEYVAESLPVIDLPPPAAAVPAVKNNNTVPDGLPPGMGGNDAVVVAAAAATADENNPGEDMGAILRRFHQRAAVAAVVSDDERKTEETAGKKSSDGGSEDEDRYDEDDDDDDKKPMSKRKLREMTRPTVADLKRRVKRPDLVEAHDITAADADFLIHLKAVPGTVPVPRHWGRKRKYLQGKRGFEKPPFQVCMYVLFD